jgi:hypothetical protein
MADMYASQLGKFLSRDPVGYFDFSNLYQFVNDNPANRLDPSGKTCKAYTTCCHTCEVTVSAFGRTPQLDEALGQLVDTVGSLELLEKIAAILEAAGSPESEDQILAILKGAIGSQVPGAELADIAQQLSNDDYWGKTGWNGYFRIKYKVCAGCIFLSWEEMETDWFENSRGGVDGGDLFDDKILAYVAAVQMCETIKDMSWPAGT